jgi:hypothetical protein
MKPLLERSDGFGGNVRTVPFAGRAPARPAARILAGWAPSPWPSSRG